MPRCRKSKKQFNCLLTNPELYEDVGIMPPKGVILYRNPELFCNKKQLVDAVNNRNIPFASTGSMNMSSRI